MATIKTRKESGGFQWSHTLVMDFSKLSEDQKQELMFASAAIRWQARARKLSDKELDELAKGPVKVDVSELFERATPTVDPLKIADKMSNEQAAELLKALQAKLGIEAK